MNQAEFDAMATRLSEAWGVSVDAVKWSLQQRGGLVVTDTPTPTAKAIPIAGSRASIDELAELSRKAGLSLKASAGKVAPVTGGKLPRPAGADVGRVEVSEQGKGAGKLIELREFTKQ